MSKTLVSLMSRLLAVQHQAVVYMQIVAIKSDRQLTMTLSTSDQQGAATRQPRGNSQFLTFQVYHAKIILPYYYFESFNLESLFPLDVHARAVKLLHNLRIINYKHLKCVKFFFN